METLKLVKVIFIVVSGLVSFFFFTNKKAKKRQAGIFSLILVISLLAFFWGLYDDYWILLCVGIGLFFVAVHELFFGEISAAIFKDSKEKKQDSQEDPSIKVSEYQGSENERSQNIEDAGNCKQSDKNLTSPKRESKRIYRWVWVIAIGVILILGIFGIFERDSQSTDPIAIDSIYPEESFSERKIKFIVEDYCNAIVENNFDELTQLYAPFVERFQNAKEKDREYVIDCHRRYDEKFKVYGKHSSLRWETLKIDEIENGNCVSVIIVEDYSIDREDRSKKSTFVLEKHFIINKEGQIVSVYDEQIR